MTALTSCPAFTGCSPPVGHVWVEDPNHSKDESEHDEDVDHLFVFYALSRMQTFFSRCPIHREQKMDDRRQIIFIHLEKTGGTSIVRAIWGHERSIIQDKSYDNGLTKHYSVAKARLLTTEYRWNNYLRFAVVRNPWDRLVSKWWWRHNGTEVDQRPATLQLTEDGKIPLKWFEEEFEEERQRWRLLTDTPTDEFLFGAISSSDDDGWKTGDEPCVKEVLRFESLQQDWAKLIDKYPAHFKGCKRELPWCNKSANRELDYRIYYTDETRDLVERSCPKIITYFNYMF